MKTQAKLLCCIFFFTACQSYQPITKGKKEDYSVEKRLEYLKAELAELEKSSRIQVTSKSGKALELKFQSFSQDTLFANYNMLKNNYPIKIPLLEIEEVKVSKINLPITLILVGASTAGIIILLSDLEFSMGYW